LKNSLALLMQGSQQWRKEPNCRGYGEEVSVETNLSSWRERKSKPMEFFI